MKTLATVIGGLTAIGLAIAPIQANARDLRHPPVSGYGGHHWHGHRDHGWHGNRGYRGHYYRHRDHGGDAALGIIGGLAAGAIIGGALANSGSRVAPRSRAWYDWCSSHYRSFNPNTGTYRGYDGRDHTCVVR